MMSVNVIDAGQLNDRKFRWPERFIEAVFFTQLVNTVYVFKRVEFASLAWSCLLAIKSRAQRPRQRMSIRRGMFPTRAEPIDQTTISFFALRKAYRLVHAASRTGMGS